MPASSEIDPLVRSNGKSPGVAALITSNRIETIGAVPIGIGGLRDVVNSPMYATGVGLVLYGSKAKTQHKFRIRDRNIYGKVKARMKEWMGELF